MTTRFIEMQTARAWGKVPSEWDNLSPEDKAIMIATNRVEQKMAAWERYNQEQDIKKKS